MGEAEQAAITVLHELVLLTGAPTCLLATCPHRLAFLFTPPPHPTPPFLPDWPRVFLLLIGARDSGGGAAPGLDGGGPSFCSLVWRGSWQLQAPRGPGASCPVQGERAPAGKALDPGSLRNDPRVLGDDPSVLPILSPA